MPHNVIACEQADQYLVAWQSDQGTTGDAIYARFIGGDGTPAGVHLIDDTTSQEQEAEVACNPSGQQYMLVWQTRYVNLKYGIWGRLAYPDETFGDSFGIVQPGTSADRTASVVAGGHTRYLVAWEHQRDGTSYQDIHGRLLAPHALFLPLVLRNN